MALATCATAAYADGNQQQCASLYAEASGAAFKDVRGRLLYRVARCEALAGRREVAFERLEMAIDAGWADIGALEADRDLDALREEDPRWRALVAKAEAARAALEKDNDAELRGIFERA